MTETKIMLKGHVVTSNGISPKNGFVEVQGSKITSVGESAAIKSKTAAAAGHCIYDFDSAYICPGFIDLHIHGAGGSDVMDGTPEALDIISCTLARGGTTSFLATTMSAPFGELVKVIKNIRDFSLNSTHGARIQGVHLEGPFLNPGRRGAQKAENLRRPSIREMRAYVEAGEGAVRMITLAPELPGAQEVIQYAKAQGVIVSLGHSNASYEQVNRACDAGLAHVTHTFNTMGELHHRSPGTAGAALSIEQLTADVIPDGIHIHPAVIKTLVRAKGIETVCAITDSIRAGLMDDGVYELGGQTVTVKDGVSRLADGTISGSVISMNQAVRILVGQVGLSLNDAVRMASENPARILGLESKGALLLGMDADIVILDKNYNVLMTMVEGQIVFQA